MLAVIILDRGEELFVAAPTILSALSEALATRLNPAITAQLEARLA
jgi:hypothetical protein